MSSFLLCIGNAAARLLPDIFTAFSCGAADSIQKLNVFCISDGSVDNTEASSLKDNLNACSSLFSSIRDSHLFITSFSLNSCTPVFRSTRGFSDDPDAAMLISALRGKGLPLSFHTDSEAVEWSFSDLLSHPDDDSIQPLLSWLTEIRSIDSGDQPIRLTIMADLSNTFASGVTLVLLQEIRRQLAEKNLYLSLIALSEAQSPVGDAFYRQLRTSLQAIEDRSLLRFSDSEDTFGADSLWLLSLPSSLTDSSEAFHIIALSAAHILSDISNLPDLPAPGLHTRETEGTVSLASLGTQAPDFVSFVRLSVWMITDFLPSLRTYFSHPARFRSLAPGAKNTVFRQLFTDLKQDDVLIQSINLLDTTFRKLLLNILRFVHSVPASMRLSAENTMLWQKAVEACGRCVTVASEYDVSVTEAHDSGLDTVRPVHRVSLADTDEEQLIRRLQEMKLQLDNEVRNREDILSSLGGYRSLQVRQDCLLRCRSALKEAEKKASGLPDNSDNLTILKLERRIRLLRAAVLRCEKDLEPATVQKTVSALPDSSSAATDPYAGTFFSPDACHALEKYIEDGNNTQPVRLPPLISDLSEPDSKIRYKLLLTACSEPDSDHSLSCVVNNAMHICLKEIAGNRFLSRGIMPPLPLLPDLVQEIPLLRIPDVLRLLPGNSDTNDDQDEKRGLLAMLLIRQYRRRSASEAILRFDECLPDNSPVVRYWLASRHADHVLIVSLEKDGKAFPFAVFLPAHSFIPARRTSAHTALIPSFATWFDRDRNVFTDPCGILGEGDRKLLSGLLSSYCKSLSSGNSTAALSVFLDGFLRDMYRERPPFAEDPDLKTRLRAVCGLRTIPAYASSLSTVTSFYEHFLKTDQLGSCLTGKSDFPAADCTDIPEEVLYLYRDIPFAREDSVLLLESPHTAEEDYTLKRLSEECAVLSESSDDYRDALLQNLPAMTKRSPDALPDVLTTVLSLIEEARKPVEKREPTFIWPWDQKSPSILTVLRESLGEAFSSAALQPFSDFLTVFPARGMDVIGDTLLSSMCSVPPRVLSSVTEETGIVPPDAVLPPLSPEFGSALCSLSEGRTLLKPGLLLIERTEEDSFRITLTLDGAFPVHLVRTYSSDEILYLYAHDIPTVAVWPSVPFPKDDWNAYYVYAHLPESYDLSVLPEGGEFTDLICTNNERYIGILETCPFCISLYREGRTVGLIPNLLPQPVIESREPIDICVDFGSTGTSVVFASRNQRRPMQGPVMVRTLINNPSASKDLLRREFLPAVPVSALLPTVTNIFRNVPGSAPLPFADGIILMSSSLEDLLSTPSEALYTSLKWEEEKGRSGFLCLHQVLLMAALQTRFEGASAVSWRFCLPDEMAKEGRENLMNLFRTLCENVHHESSYAIPPQGLPVAFASESSALGAYFRCCASEDTRGGFMVLDLGACTADISLFMRGREQAVRTCQIPLGIHYMLLPSLLRDPDLPARELGFCTDEAFQRDLSLLCRALHAAKTDAVALRRARVALDFFISDHLQILVNAMLQLASAGTSTRLGAIMLLHFSYLLMLSGLVLLQLSADPSKNDFLPEQMTLCLSGRGSSLLEILPPQLKNALWHFLAMFRNRKVSSMSLLFSAEKKMEIPVGLSMLQEIYTALPPASAIPASIAVRPAALLPEFLLRFRGQFPASADLLFPGFFTNDFYHPFTARGESVITASVDQSFPPAETPRPYDSLSAWIGNLLDMLS